MLEAGGLRLLIDCGMHQEREFLARNWESFPVSPQSVDCVILTHAHLDHSGLLPKLVREGFRGEIVTTPATRDLAQIILEDAAHIQEEDAAYKRRRHQREGRTGKHPEAALYESADARACMRLFRTVQYGQEITLGDGVRASLHDAGHILGSAMVELRVRHNGDERTLVFSGDIGQRDKPIVRDPTSFERADYVVMESTYGDEDHEDNGPVQDQLADVINEAVAAGGNILIPTFAVERAQELMFHLGALVRADRIPHLMVFLDSPMAVDVTEVFRRYTDCMDERMKQLLESQGRPFHFTRLNLVRSSSESKAINRIRGSCIILAGSGMCTGGRIKHHLARNVARPESTIVFVGYQARGTLGREISSGKPAVRILGQEHQVRAKVKRVYGLSAHADRTGLLEWAGHFDTMVLRRLFLTHGEQHAAQALAGAIKERHGCQAEIPDYRAAYDLAGD